MRSILGVAQAICLIVLVTAVSLGAVPVQLQTDEERDFIPGERTIFFDDFSDMTRGGALPHWKLRGGTAKLTPESTLMLRDQGAMYANLKTLPKNYTAELRIVPSATVSSGGVRWMFTDAADESVWSVNFQFDEGEILVGLEEGHSHSDFEGRPRGTHKFAYGKPVTFSVWFQDRRIRAYVDDDRMFDVNQVEMKPSTIALLEFNVSDVPTAIVSARIAESLPDATKTLFSTGKYVTHAIQFDVNSDRLRPESMNVIRQVADELKKQPTVKVRIEGHTDSTGDAAKNLDLSKRRADSVRAELVKLGIDGARLATDGLGQTKPLTTNDTPQGRAENRRVEFVKL